MAAFPDTPERAIRHSNRAAWILGVDPGASGGIARIWGSGRYECWPMPKSEHAIARLFKQLLSEWGCQGIFLEKVWGRKGNSAKAMTTFMTHYGVIRGCLALLTSDFEVAPPLVDVLPTVWQRAVNAPVMSRDKEITAYIRKKEHKRALYDIAEKMFPQVKVTLKTCDALLLAEYGCKDLWT